MQIVLGKVRYVMPNYYTSRGGGVLGSRVLLGICRWPLRTPTPL